MRMMKSTLLTLIGAALLCSCGGGKATKALTGQVTMDGYEGRKVYMETTVANPTRVDSAIVKDGRFEFNLQDSVPQVYMLVLAQSDDDQFPITLPVVSEKGNIRVFMGELVLTMGTPLNDSLQDFLLALSNYRDQSLADENVSVEGAKKGMSELLEAAVKQNIKTPVGAYIYRYYLEFLDEAQRAGILEMADEDFRKAVNQ